MFYSLGRGLKLVRSLNGEFVGIEGESEGRQEAEEDNSEICAK